MVVESPGSVGFEIVTFTLKVPIDATRKYSPGHERPSRRFADGIIPTNGERVNPKKPGQMV